MYRKKELIIIMSLILILIIAILSQISRVQKDNTEIQSEYSIQINIEGEVVRKVELICYHPISYGALFLKIKHCLNEFSDISNFDLDEMIVSSRTIEVPSLDINNRYEDTKVYINEGVINDLVKLPQIGEKRAQKIIDYIKIYGCIDTWEKLWEVTNVPKESRQKIMDQAVL